MNANSAFGFTDEEFDVLKRKSEDLIAELNRGKYSSKTIVAIARNFGCGFYGIELAEGAFIITCLGFDPQNFKQYKNEIVGIYRNLKAKRIENCREILEKLSKPSGELSSLDLSLCFFMEDFDQLNKSKFATTVATVMRCNNYINKVNLSRNKIGDEGATTLSEALKVNSSIFYLYLGGNKIGDTGATALSEALKVNSSVIYLNLDSNRIGNKGAIAFSEYLKGNKALICLILVGNNIGNEGATTLSKALKEDDALLYLDLSQNYNIGEGGLIDLSKMLEVNPRLIYIDLVGVHMTHNAEKSLTDAFGKNTTITILPYEKKYDPLRSIVSQRGDLDPEFVSRI